MRPLTPRIKASVRQALRAVGFELRRFSDLDLPSLQEFELFGEPFRFWIANRHTHAWWGGGVAETAELRWQRDACRPGGTVIDVGGHHGMNALMFARAVGEEGRVLSVEAEPDNAVVLHANVGANGVRNLTVYDVAVGAEAGNVRFAQESVSDGEGRAVRKETLDTLRDRFGADEIDLLKIDVEGFEAEVLAGGTATLEASRHISLELHLDLLARYGRSRDDVLAHFPLDRYSVQTMTRPNWDTMRPLASWAELPADGVVNLFLTRRNLC